MTTLYQSLKVCSQNKRDCFAYLTGRCNCLNNTHFEYGRECPFYKSRDKMPDFDRYFKEYIMCEVKPK